ncbi:MAG: M56 family metallopeptidase, partial [Candidatus Baltobacteraceae bacterium]
MNDPFGSFGTFALTFLANGLWEALLLAGAAAFVLRLSPAANATTRHAVLVTALVAAIALPVLTTALAFAPHPEASQATRVATVPPLKTVRATVVTTRVTSTRSNASALSSSLQIGPGVARPQLTLPRLAILALVGLWLAGALFFLVRLAISLVHLERLKRDALPLPIAFREQLERWTAVGRGRRDVRLCRSAETTVPIAVGLFDAMILLPDRLLEDLAPEDLDRIVLHELAHLRRGDDWSNGFERLAEAVLFFNPGVRWLVRQLDLEREVA